MLNRLTDVFKSFQKHNVRYVVIGGIAAILYGVPRATFDLDILIEATPENAQNLLDALADARIGTADLTTSQKVLANEITIFQDRVRIDVQTFTPGLEFSVAWQHRQEMQYQKQKFFVASKADLIASKLAAGRPVDLEDVKALRVDEEK
jgi:hypothetical protein